MREPLPPISADGPERRSTRVREQIPLIVTWVDAAGATHREESTTISVNCHGCRYYSRFSLRKNARVILEIGAVPPESIESSSPAPAPLDRAQPVRQLVPARVVSVTRSRRLPGLHQVGLELETPQGIWPVQEPPQDWRWFGYEPYGDPGSFVVEMDGMLQLARAGQQRKLLGVNSGESRVELKHRFYQLARRFHPDRHMDHPEWKPRLEALMDALALAYRSLAGEESPGITGANGERGPEPGSEARSLAQQFAENAQACLATKNYAGSIVWLRRAIQAEPQVSKYRALLGVSLAQVPEYRREALEQFEKAIEIAPGDPSAYFHYGQVLEQMKQPWRAKTFYLRVLELDPLHREARQRLEQLKAPSPRAASLPFLLNHLTGRTRG